MAGAAWLTPWASDLLPLRGSLMLSSQRTCNYTVLLTNIFPRRRHGLSLEPLHYLFMRRKNSGRLFRFRSE